MQREISANPRNRPGSPTHWEKGGHSPTALKWRKVHPLEGVLAQRPRCQRPREYQLDQQGYCHTSSILVYDFRSSVALTCVNG